MLGGMGRWKKYDHRRLAIRYLNGGGESNPNREGFRSGDGGTGVPLCTAPCPSLDPFFSSFFSCSCRCRLLPTTAVKCCRLGAYHGPLPNSGAVAIYLDSCLRHATWEANIGSATTVSRLGYFWTNVGQSCLFQWKHPILLTTPWACGSDLFVVVGCSGDMMPYTGDLQVKNQDVAPLSPKVRFKTSVSSYVIDAPCLYDGTNYTTTPGTTALPSTSPLSYTKNHGLLQIYPPPNASSTKITPCSGKLSHQSHNACPPVMLAPNAGLPPQSSSPTL